MADYELVEEFYLLPTAAGAFYAVSHPKDGPLRRLLLTLLQKQTSIKVDNESLADWFGTDNQQYGLEQLHRAQTLSLIQGYHEPQEVPNLGIGQELQDILPQLSSVGKAMLADWNGLSLSRCGISDETANILSALSADLIAVQNRHAERLEANLGLGTQGWAAVDAYGSSRIGAWPLFIGEQRFMLVLMGEPQLNKTEFIALIWVLINRYG
jgi:hypothetical protein